jgi:hypothetical protein
VPITNHRGLPKPEFLKHKNSLIIYDDLQFDIADDPASIRLTTETAHHGEVTLFFLFQCYIWSKNSVIRTMLLNVQYFIFMAGRRQIFQVKHFLLRNFPSDWQERLSIFEKATVVRYSHLLFDLHPSTREEHIMRGNILPNEITCFLELP